MSAPDTNVERQATRHKPAMLAIVASILFAGILFAIFTGYVATDATTPVGADQQVDGRTGAVVEN